MARKKKKEEHEEKRETPKSILGKIWQFIWYDDSILSWIVNILLAYVIIKFIVYPGLGLLLGTGFPIVAVVSNSMEHQTSHPCLKYDLNGECLAYDKTKNEICGKSLNTSRKFSFSEYWDVCGDYYMSKNITKTQFASYSLTNGFNRGDIMLLIGKKPKDVNVGDIIVFQSKKAYPIIHRVISKESKGLWVFQTKGDHNLGQITDFQLDETRVLENQILGKAVVRIPWFGYVKIWFVDLLNMIRGTA